MLFINDGVDFYFLFLTKMVLEFGVSGSMFDLQYRAAGLAFL